MSVAVILERKPTRNERECKGYIKTTIPEMLNLPGRSGAGYQFILYIAYAVIFLLAIIAVAFLRSNYREKHKLHLGAVQIRGLGYRV